MSAETPKQNDDHPVPGKPRPVLHAPEVHTMQLGHIPLAIFGTASVTFLFATAFHLGLASAIAGNILLVVLFVLAAVFRLAGPKTPDLDTPAAATTGTRFTVVRIIITCTLGGLALVPAGAQPPDLLWSLVVLGAVCAVLEASDDWLARITGSASSFSARLGQMTTALFALSLGLLPWQIGLLGGWIVVAGVLGAADAAIAPRRSAGDKAMQRGWLRLGLRAATLAVLVPALPDPVRYIAGALAILAAVYVVGSGLQARMAARQADRTGV